jgi:hypothetical protein
LPRKPSRLRSIFKLVLILLALAVAVVLALPTILSMGWMRSRMEREMSRNLGTDVRLGGFSMGWLSGLSIDDLKIANPTGFSATDDLFAMKSLRGDASFTDLLRGRFGIEGSIDGLALRVVQRADGTTNVGSLLGVKAGGPSDPKADPDRGPAPSELPAQALDLADLRLDLQLRDALIEVSHEVNGVLERLEHVEAKLSKSYGDNVIRLTFACDLTRPSGGSPGRLEFSLDADADPTKPIAGGLRAKDLDLARYRPILATFLPADRIEAFEGVVAANTTIHGRRDQEIVVDGSIEISKPRIAGQLVGGLDLGADTWRIEPGTAIAMDATGKPKGIDVARLAVDLGFCKLRGLPTEPSSPGALGIGFDFDVDALAARGGELLAAVKGSGTRVQGTVRLPAVDKLGTAEIASLVKEIGIEATALVKSLPIGGQELGGVNAKLGMSGGTLALEVQSGTYGGGPLALRAKVDAADFETLPIEASIEVDGARIGAQAIEALQYVFPLAAGAAVTGGSGAPVGLDGKFGLKLSFTGEAMPTAGVDTLTWLSGFSGKGSIGIAEGKLRPAAGLQSILQLAGGASELGFKDFASEFSIAKGFVESLGGKLEAAGQNYGLVGKTGFDGKLAWSVDVRNLLASRKDGKRVLELIGSTPIDAALGGTLDAPSLVMPKIDEIVKTALEKAVKDGAKNLLEGEAKGLLDSVLGGRKKETATGGSGGDTSPSVLDQILQGGGKLPGKDAPPPNRRPDPVGDMLREVMERQRREAEAKKRDGGSPR